MATPNEKLATSLTTLHELQKDGKRVFRSEDLTRFHKERLLAQGFIQEVMRGWFISSSPNTQAGDSTPWYASFWEFCGRYCDWRFGDKWHLSPEQSLWLHAENTVIPTQAVINSPDGKNNKVALPFGTSLYDLREVEYPPPADLVVRDGLRMFSAAAALVRISERFLQRHPVEGRVVLSSIRDASEILTHLLAGGHSVVAGRLAGAFRNCGRPDIADEILSTMKGAGYSVRETDPFAAQAIVPRLPAAMPPIENRIRALWGSMRDTVIETFPSAPGLPKDRKAWLHAVEEIYTSDAYHSLSIEGYSVSVELIERVRAGNWDPERHQADKKSRDALAARGYWQAFQVVKNNVGEIIAGSSPGALIRNSHRDWYRELFGPCVLAGLIRPEALAGYRHDAVYLRTSRNVPPRWEAVRDAIPALFDLLEKEPEPGVRAVLGHWIFGFIHPYPDGNGRIARFLMNAMLASGGYPWTVVRVEDRAEYLAALDKASIEADIQPFAEFIGERVRVALKVRR